MRIAVIDEQKFGTDVYVRILIEMVRIIMLSHCKCIDLALPV